MNDPVFAQVRASLKDRADGRIIVAVSGGSDSVGLLRLMHGLTHDFGLTLSVAHVDHGARAGSAEDARFVGALADELELPFDLASWRPTRPGHFETDARAARYRLLAEIARNRGAGAVAVGHTKDDQAETILLRLLRGTGPRGLAGMLPVRRLADGIDLIRPLLDVTRADVRATLDRLGQAFRDDPTNDDRARTRNRVRHELLPLLADQFNPRIAETLVRLGRLMAEQERDEARRTRRTARRIALPSCSEEIISLDRPMLRRLSPRRRAELFRHLWREAGWPEQDMDAARWRRLATLADEVETRLDIGAGVVATVANLSVTLSRIRLQLTAPQSLGEITLDVPGEIDWHGGRLIAVVDPDARRDETVDLDRIEPPLTVRGARPGDRFTPLGMSGSTALNDFFRGRRVRPEARQSVPLLCDAAGIVWVAGHRIADRVRQSESTTRTLGLRWVRHGCD